MEVGWAAFFLLLLVACSGVGLAVQSRLGAQHKSSHTIDSVRMIVAMVVTFAALVLGLLVTSVKDDFEEHAATYRRYGIALFEFDRRLTEYGEGVAPIRANLRAFTAAVLADTWPDEPVPSGTYPRQLHTAAPGSDETAEFTTLLTSIDAAVQGLAPTDPFHQHVAAVLQENIRQIEAVRWSLVERASSRLSPILIAVLMFWLCVVFLVFGLVSPRNRLVHATLLASALVVSSCLYLILDLDTPVGGLIHVPSRPLRDALWHMDHGAGG